jgi:hypothetical protein
MDRMKDASEGGIEAATVPGVDALIRVHVPKHGAETLGEAAISPDSTLGIAVPTVGPIAGLPVMTYCGGFNWILPVNDEVMSVPAPRPFRCQLAAHS